MVTLIAIAYPDIVRAKDVLNTLGALHLIHLMDAAVVIKDGTGKLKIQHAASRAASGALGGAVGGFLLGTLFAAPVFGAMVGAASGALVGNHFTERINDRIIAALGERLHRNSSALCILVTRSTLDDAIGELSKYGGTVLQTSLPLEAEAQLKAALQAGHTRKAPDEGACELRHRTPGDTR